MSHTAGLKADGTVVATGDNYEEQCKVGGWTGIVQVSAGYAHTVGVKDDGSVVAVGNNNSGQCDVAGWTDLVEVAAGGGHTVGLKDDGIVFAVGHNIEGQCDVGNWTDIVQVAAGDAHTVGLKDDGTVVAAAWEAELAKWNLGGAALHLTISSTAGGNVTRPGEGTFPYYAGRVVNLVAEPEAGYRFVNWTGEVDTVARVSAATTIITMHGDYVIIANFEEKPRINWLLVGWIIAAVIAVGLGVFFVRRKRGARARKTLS